ncbi:MAG: hypothetical protein C4555_04415 [Dehalococcoidia bacterium]|nr:MAG: hypothetical protein C4555_04415 [Dehalococcoidia bacterium]
MKTIFVLGAPDPEMDAIERMLTDAGACFEYALGQDGCRVHPGNAYDAVPPSSDGLHVAVECGWPGQLTFTCNGVTRIRDLCDHHRPGDPGYGAGPEAYWWASSIGQVARRLSHHQLDRLEWTWSEAPPDGPHVHVVITRDGPIVPVRTQHAAQRQYRETWVAKSRYYTPPEELLLIAEADHTTKAR